MSVENQFLNSEMYKEVSSDQDRIRLGHKQSLSKTLEIMVKTDTVP